MTSATAFGKNLWAILQGVSAAWSLRLSTRPPPWSSPAVLIRATRRTIRVQRSQAAKRELDATISKLLPVTGVARPRSRDRLRDIPKIAKDLQLRFLICLFPRICVCRVIYVLSWFHGVSFHLTAMACI